AGIVSGGSSAAFAIVTENHAVVSAADADSILQQLRKDALKVERRPADGLGHLGRGSLLPQRFAQLSVRACTSSNKRTFSIAITAWSAKVVANSICLSVNVCTLGRAGTITRMGGP